MAQRGAPRAARRAQVLGALLVCLLAAACARRTPAPPTGGPGVTPAVETPPALASATVAAPSLTPVPLAATVNGQPVPLASYEREVARCQAGLAAAGLDPAAGLTSVDCPSAALESLIEQAVVEQAALAAGVAVSAAEVDEALAGIVAQVGGPEAHAAWLAANDYTAGEFRAALEREMLRARQAEQVVSAVGPTAEQVHARAILVASADTAQAVLDQVQAGADFATLALEYSRDLSSRVAGGDLGWFPRGVLTVPEVEEAAFALQPGETSRVIESPLGYHIVQTLARDTARPLSPAAVQALRAARYEQWLAEQLAGAEIARLVNLE